MVVFKYAFNEENLHSILDGDGVDGGKCFLYLFKGDVKVGYAKDVGFKPGISMGQASLCVTCTWEKP